MHASDPIFDEQVSAALEAVRDTGDVLRVVERLRERLPHELARRVAELHRLRRKARGKFPRHAPPYLTTKGYEQASSEAVADARAAHIAAVDPTAWVADLTCGIGADTLALGRVGQKVVACDIDAVHLAYTAANLRAAGQPVRVLRADAARSAERAPICILDPDRRASGRRILDPERSSPPLSTALKVLRGRQGGCLKLAPALDPAPLEGALPAGLGGRLEWVSVRGELVELTLWTGCLAGLEPGSTPPRRATRLDREGGSASFEGLPEAVQALPPDAEPAFLADPDPALVRSGLLGSLARRAGLRPIAPRCAYLGGERPPTASQLAGAGSLLTPMRVLGRAALDPRRVRRLLAEHDIGPIAVRKRGHSETAEKLARRFAGPGARRGELVVARLERGHVAYLVERLVGDEGFEPPTSSL